MLRHSGKMHLAAKRQFGHLGALRSCRILHPCFNWDSRVKENIQNHRVERVVGGQAPTLADLLKPFVDAFRNRSLIIALVVASEKSMFHRIWLGMAWKYIEPLMMVATYFIFLSAVRGSAAGSTWELLAVILTGLMFYEIFRRSLVSSCTVYLSFQSILTSTNTPLIVVFMCGLAQTVAANYPVWLMAVLMAAFAYGPSAHIVFIPPLILLAFFCIAPFALAVSFIGIYFRDLGRLLEVLMRALLFISPVLYETRSVTGKLQKVLAANPMSAFIEGARDLLFRGEFTQGRLLLIVIGMSLVMWPIALWMVHRIGRRVVKVL